MDRWVQKTARTAASAFLAAGLLTGAAQAFPTSNNVIPTPDMLEAGQVRIEVENDGFTAPFNADRSQYFVLGEVGITSWLEVGVDAFDVSHDATFPANAKLSLLEESDFVPAFAAGIMDVVRGKDPSFYGVTGKSFGAFRAQLGWLRTAEDDHLIAGADYKLTENLYALTDWTSGSDGFLTLGLWQRIAGELWVNVAYGRANDREAKDLLLLNLQLTFPVWHSKQDPSQESE